MLVDEVKISVVAGGGGAGRVAFDTSKGGRGPTGGSGGRGGDVYFEGVSDLAALRQFRHKKDFAAENGMDGRDKNLDGRDGESLTLKVPVGTIIKNLDNNKVYEIVSVGGRVKILRGGRGGRGNFHFRGPTNTSPMQSEKGNPGEEASIFLELQLIADVGFIGFPNAGKSSLLNELTSAKARVANFPFTTLEPNLGVFFPPKELVGENKELYGKYLILADIPGLIEGASKGKGLGYKFLRHIRRTKMFLHCIAADSENVLKDYKVIRKELADYQPELLNKKEVALLTKSDLIDSKEFAKKKETLSTKKLEVLGISIYDPEAIQALKKLLTALIGTPKEV